jgi:hypothetical protein
MENSTNYVYPCIFTFCAFCVNAIIDKGIFIPIDEMIAHIEKRTVWDLLERQNINSKFLSNYSQIQRNELMDYFERSAITIDADKEFLIQRNGCCLLLAYLINAIQSGKESGQFTSLK